VLNTQALWDSLHTALLEHMKTITLKSLADDQRARGFKVPERKATKKGVLQKLKLEAPRPTAPNSVFALGQVWRHTLKLFATARALAQGGGTGQCACPPPAWGSPPSGRRPLAHKA